jgi:hypothetical protein
MFGTPGNMMQTHNADRAKSPAASQVKRRAAPAWIFCRSKPAPTGGSFLAQRSGPRAIDPV